MEVDVPAQPDKPTLTLTPEFENILASDLTNLPDGPVQGNRDMCVIHHKAFFDRTRLIPPCRDPQLCNRFLSSRGLQFYGMNWVLNTHIHTDIDGNFEVQVFLSCEPDAHRYHSKIWKCNVETNIRLMYKDETCQCTEKAIMHNNFSRNEVMANTMEFLISPKADIDSHSMRTCVMLDVVFHVIPIKGFRESWLTYDHYSTTLGMNGNFDTKLQVGEHVFIVPLAVLLQHSAFFRGMYAPHFEHFKKEVNVLNEVAPDEFKELLEIIYPTAKPIDDNNVVYILQLAERFVMPYVTDRCEEFLKTTEGFSFLERLQLSERYTLFRLQNAVLDELTGLDIQVLYEDREFNLLEKETIMCVLGKMTFLHSQDQYGSNNAIYSPHSPNFPH